MSTMATRTLYVTTAGGAEYKLCETVKDWEIELSAAADRLKVEVIEDGMVRVIADHR